MSETRRRQRNRRKGSLSALSEAPCVAAAPCASPHERGFVIIAVVDEPERRVRGAKSESWFRHTGSQDLAALATGALVEDGTAVASCIARTSRRTRSTSISAISLRCGMRARAVDKAMVELGRPRPTEEQAMRGTPPIAGTRRRPTFRADPVVRRSGASRLGHLAFVADVWGVTHRSHDALSIHA